MFHWNKKSLESSRLQEQRTSCQERKEGKGITLTTMLIFSFENWSCIPESWVRCLFSGLCCNNIQVYAIWDVLVLTAPLWGQGSSLTNFSGQRNNISEVQVCSGSSSLLAYHASSWVGRCRKGQDGAQTHWVPPAPRHNTSPICRHCRFGSRTWKWKCAVMLPFLQRFQFSLLLFSFTSCSWQAEN